MKKNDIIISLLNNLFEKFALTHKQRITHGAELLKIIFLRMIVGVEPYFDSTEKQRLTKLFEEQKFEEFSSLIKLKISEKNWAKIVDTIVVPTIDSYIKEVLRP